ncbi:MAG: DUF6089 family protein [Bacteroidia bacterium]|nr:DUF6089 family protein [Bacteroidia bacterium]
MLRIVCLTFLCCLTLTPSLLAQRTHSFSVGIGTLYYYGDLTDKFNNSLLRPAVQLGYNRYMLPNLSFRVAGQYGEIGASDNMAIDPGRQVRNLHFRSTIVELSGVLMYEFFRDKNFGNEWIGKPHLTPYVFLGVSLFHFNPKASANGEWYALQPLGTEGQNIPNSGNPGPYSLIQWSAPLGVGLNLRLTPYTGVGVELGYRTTATDYLDDVSTVYPDFEALGQASGEIAVQLSERSVDNRFRPGQIRGNPGSKDSYFFTAVTINYYLSRYATRN